jgi:SIR2-like protein
LSRPLSKKSTKRIKHELARRAKKTTRRKRSALEERRDANLDELAKRLMARHLRLSVPDRSVRALLAEHYDRETYPDEMIERRMRCVAIVGAGASAPVLARGKELADTLEKDFGRDEVELERLRLVNNLKSTHFETRLMALSRTPEAERKVRETIAREYRIRYPPLLANELLAHLLKHRFLDAIISFNFDELLDQSIEDELGPSEYVQVVSERDCSDIQVDPDKPDYIPLYVKLHGTASEPASLRFTPDSYYAIPDRISSVVADLLDGEHCVLLNVGTGLTSFDFQRLLAYPKRLELFNLSLKELPGRIRKEINKRRRRAKGLGASKGGTDPRPVSLYECATNEHGCDTQIRDVVAAVQRATESPRLDPRHGSGPLVRWRSVLRHEAVATLFQGSRGGPWSKTAEAQYLERRVILELALAAAKARGLMSLLPLSQDRAGRYYDRYRRLRVHGAASWRGLCSAAGLEECEELPDALISRPAFRKRDPPIRKRKAKHKRRAKARLGKSRRAVIERRKESQRLHELEPSELADYVIARITPKATVRQRTLLTDTIRGMQSDSEIELHTQDDRVCSKEFRNPATLRTTTSLQVYTWLMFRDLSKRDRVYICAETGAWLTRGTMPDLLRKSEHIRSLHVFAVEHEAVRTHYLKKHLAVEFVNPWHHNRHMTVVCRGEEPVRAIYFARHQRRPVITAVYLNNPIDVRRMKGVHETRWAEAREARKRTSNG